MSPQRSDQSRYDAGLERIGDRVSGNGWLNRIVEPVLQGQSRLARIVFTPLDRFRTKRAPKIALIEDGFAAGSPRRTGDGWIVGVERRLPGWEPNPIVYSLRPTHLPAALTEPDHWQLVTLKKTTSESRAFDSYLKLVRRHDGLRAVETDKGNLLRRLLDGSDTHDQ